MICQLEAHEPPLKRDPDEQELIATEPPMSTDNASSGPDGQETNDHLDGQPASGLGSQSQYFQPYSQEDKCDHNPEFAVICSFIANFGHYIDLELNIEQLRSSIENQEELDDSLIDIHVKLLKKIRRYFVRDQWEKALIRFTSEYSYEDAYEIERLGYLKTRPSIKLQLLRRLLDAQFESDQKFKSQINSSDATNLRLRPFGRDIKGNTYWHQSDSAGNLRIFQEEPLDYRSWKAICSTNDELSKLIEELDSIKEFRVKGEPMAEPYNPIPEIFSELFIKKEEGEEQQGEVEEGEGEEKQEGGSMTKKAISRGGRRKGRGKNRGKKCSDLPIVQEADCEDSNDKDAFPITNGHAHPVKLELESNDQLISSISPPSPDQGSIEFHVKSILDTIINKIVSFDFIKRPLSRNSENAEPELDQKIKCHPVKAEPQPKKRKDKKEKPPVEALPRRSSSRIQQIQLKKIAEQEEEIKKMIESNAIKQSNSTASLSDEDSRSRTSFKNNRPRSPSPVDDRRAGRKRRKKGQTWRRGKGKKKLSWDEDDSDLSGPSSVTEDEFEDANESFSFGAVNDDDEFACEEEDTNIEPVIVRRARTARQSLGLDEQGDPNESSMMEQDKPCQRCDKSNDPEWILLCDGCDDGYHTSCCMPPLMVVPEDDWFCPHCEHKTLLEKLREVNYAISQILEARERERLKKQKLRQNKLKKEPIAVEIEAQAELGDEILQIDAKPTIEKPPRPAPGARADIRKEEKIAREHSSRLPEKRQRVCLYNLNEFDDLDDDEEAEAPVDEAASDEDFNPSSATEVEEEEEDLDESTEAESYESETSIDELVSCWYTKKRKKKARRSSYSDEEDSDYPTTRRRRAAANNQVSYRESTDEDELDEIGGVVKKVKVSKGKVLSSGDDTEASWKGQESTEEEEEEDVSTSAPDTPDVDEDQSVATPELVDDVPTPELDDALTPELDDDALTPELDDDAKTPDLSEGAPTPELNGGVHSYELNGDPPTAPQ